MIAFSNYTCSNDISGVSSWLENLILYLRARGVPVALFLRRLEDGPAEDRRQQRIAEAGVLLECKPRPRLTATAVRQILQFLDRHQPAVFLPQCLAEGMYAARISGQVGRPWIFTHHSDDPFYWAILEATHPQQSNGRIVAISHHIARHYRGMTPPADPMVIPCGAAVPAAHTIYRNAPFRIVYSGRVIEEQKRISLVIRTFVELCRRDPRIECRVLGDGSGMGECRQTVSSAGLSDRILFTGRLDTEGVRTELSAAQAILFMSDYEGLPVALLEAMAAGVVPVCRSIASGIPEVVRHRETGLLVGADPVEACMAVLDLAGNRTLWQHCSDQAAALVASQYEISACHDRWLSLLRPYLENPVHLARQPAHRRLKLPPYNPALELNYMRINTAPARYLRALGQRLSRILPHGKHRDRPTP